MLEAEFPPRWAEPWDRVGLVVGRPEQPVTRVLAVVDVLPQTVAEALDTGADMIIAHHPLLLSGVSSVAATIVGTTIQKIVVMLINEEACLVERV